MNSGKCRFWQQKAWFLILTIAAVVVLPQA